MYDQRLFNQEGGMASGLASDDTYNLYDKALFADRGNNLYKPKPANPDDDAGDADGKDRVFKPDKVGIPAYPCLSLQEKSAAFHSPMLKSEFGDRSFVC